MTQQNSIPQQIIHFYLTPDAEEAYFRGIGDIGGVSTTIVLALTDFAVNLNNTGFVWDDGTLFGFEGNVAFTGQIRNPVELQNFIGDITQSNTGFVRLQDGQPGTLVQLDFNDSQIATTINPFREPAPTYLFEYEPTTQDYVLGHSSLPPNFDAAQYGASHPDLSNRTDLDLHDYTEHFLFGEIASDTDNNPPEGDNTPTEGDNTPAESDDNVLDTLFYRLQNKQLAGQGVYLFANEEEKNSALANFGDTFQLEGAAFYAADEPGEGLIPMHRLAHKGISGAYLFAGDTEKDTALRDFADTFRYEGIAFYAYSNDADIATDYYRLGNKNINGTYFFTNEAEKDTALRDFGDIFQLDGPAFEVRTA